MLYNSQDIITTKAFVLSLQLGDSFFPVGGFHHSFGLETYVQEGLIKSGEDLREFLNIIVEKILKHTDFLALYLIHRYTAIEDIESVIRVDQTLTATKSAYETKIASLKMGKTLLSVAVELWENKFIKQYSKRVKHGEAHGNHSSVYGIVTSVLEIPQFHSLILFIYNTVINFISVALKLLPLGQKEAQKIVCSLHKIMIKTAEEVMELSEEDIGAFAPAYEIRCMFHERLYSRLFMS